MTTRRQHHRACWILGGLALAAAVFAVDRLVHGSGRWLGVAGLVVLYVAVAR